MQSEFRKSAGILSLGVLCAVGVGMRANAATVGLWLSDEGAGTTLNDSSGNGHHAQQTYNSTGGWTTDSPFEPNAANNSYNYNVTQFDVADAPDLDPSGDFTVEAWVKFGSTTGTPCLVSKRNVGGATSGYFLEFDYIGVFSFTTGNGSSYAGTSAALGSGAFASVPFSLHTWYHIAGIHTAVENVLYVNGISNGGNGSGGAVAGNANPLTFGYYASGDKYNFDTQIDEIRLSNEALAANQLGWSVGSFADVPEPASFALAAIAGGFIAGRRRR